MAITTQTVKVDLNTGKVLPVVYAHQNDTNRAIQFEVYNENAPFSLSGYTVKFGYVSPKVNGAYTVIAGDNMASGSVSGNTVTFNIPESYLAIAGDGLLTMIISGTGSSIRPVNIRFAVQTSADGSHVMAGASDFPDAWMDEKVYSWLGDHIDGIFTEEQFADSVDAWLDDHPEATTTVEDGSITVGKLHDSLKAFVTPEMFGAKGDGVTDDSVAIQSAIDSGENVYFPSKNYLIASQIVINLKQNFSLDAEGAEIVYSGSDYAFLIQRTQWSNLRFGSITSANGGCIKLFTARENNQGTSQYDYDQYLNIYFNVLSASTDCIFANTTNLGWINEIRFHGGKLASGANGVRIVHNSSNGISHWTFYSVGIEGVTKGFNFIVDSVAETAGKYITDFEFFGLRTGEASNIFTTDGKCTRFLVSGGYDVPPSKCNIDSTADDWTIVSPNTIRIVRSGTFLNVNQKYLDLVSEPVSIPNSSDLNSASFFKEGRYKSGSSSNVSGYTNCPVSVSFIMTVESSAIYADGKNRYVWRQIQSLTNTATFLRQYAHSNDYGETWTTNPWYVFVGNEMT